MRWNGGISWPVQSGHGCIGCSEDGFWDKGSFYDRIVGMDNFGIEASADRVGGPVAGVVAGAIATHAVVTALSRSKKKSD